LERGSRQKAFLPELSSPFSRPVAKGQPTGGQTKERKINMKPQNLKSALTATVLALLVAASPAQGTGRNPNPGIIPPGSTYRGQSYGEWGAQWWKTIFSIPVVDGYHPLLSGGAFEGEKK
jgi:hypothetical protein